MDEAQLGQRAQDSDSCEVCFGMVTGLADYKSRHSV